MDQLQQARAQIDEIDAKMAALFEQRMQAVGQVAQYKARTGKQVFDPAREALVLEKNTARVQNPELQPYYREFLKKALAVSRAYQHVLIGQDVAAYQGVEGAWSHIALRQLFPFAKAQAYSTWNEVVEAVERGDAYCGVLPFENSNAGDVSAVLDLLYAHPGLKVARMCDLPIRQDLLALPGAQLSEIKTVISHQQALAQSGPFLKLHHFATKAWGNTADAARYVAEQGDQTLAAIASAETAKLYGLQILAEGVNEDGEEEDPRAELVQKLLEYKMYKYMSFELRDRQVDAARNMYREQRLPKEVEAYRQPIDYEELIGDMNLNKLHEIFKSIVKKQEDKIDPVRSQYGNIEKDEVDMDIKMLYVEAYAREHKTFSFRKLLEKQNSKMEVIVTFLIILELMKTGKINISQENIFDDIMITSNV